MTAYADELKGKKQIEEGLSYCCTLRREVAE